MSYSTMSWGKLTRSDLRGFDDYAIKIIQAAMQQGAEGRVSNKGHVILRNRKGETMAVGRKSNKAQQVLAIQVRDLFGVGVEVEEEPARQQNGNPALARAEAEAAVRAAAGPQFECQVKGCGQRFMTEGALYSHQQTAEKHYPCPQPGCRYISHWAPATSNHRKIVHEGYRPRVVGAERARAREAAATKGKRATRAVGPAKPREQVKEEARTVRVQKGDGNAAAIRRIDEWISRERAELAEEISRLSKENDELRRKLQMMREVLS